MQALAGARRLRRALRIKGCWQDLLDDRSFQEVLILRGDPEHICFQTLLGLNVTANPADLANMSLEASMGQSKAADF